ncbi:MULTISPECIES: GntR family transcriptional regulator [Rathayibacter]|jgi:DNA-binding transcriptional regulator YhcF (GntR family)|uniref:GntR family transcriptional regulator n=1 Tax=Rathayibacter caricis DSM 15933 TaxID=1328867 RepID=A0A2T4UUI2_9MICO|nr:MULTISPECIES: GntR family transcriptional regulator [Rathayibacter]KQQ10399.1 GntR family transcriptional regulator [Rathayibacter sp. Leaf296]KQQ22679.1 GntR family transcriptional regulator [Rathayibacter sp. Leaf299]MCJ1695204.1 GntR family transcriptional regulator [Rathayibacter caricis]OOB92055.1 GntR family transcriptional regulator [Rathayibacter sp. VKM Ac-2630]PTL73198.1 GntR family transcriptional regulator [Rathayibacter caricis DSM 15933]
MDDSRPIFLQIAEQIENDIIAGALPEETQVPSTNEFAAFHRINPATAGKGVNLLVDDGVLYKRRGIGMFVAEGARDRLVEKRRTQFRDQFVAPLLAEAAKLGLTREELATMISEGGSR